MEGSGLWDYPGRVAYPLLRFAYFMSDTDQPITRFSRHFAIAEPLYRTCRRFPRFPSTFGSRQSLMEVPACVSRGE
jgi:hypothetical protein